MQLSFGMIFSIILIIVFVAFAIYAIMKFLSINKNVEIAQFKENLKNDVNEIRRGLYGSVPKTYTLPKNIEKVCFVDLESEARGENSELFSVFRRNYNGNENLFFYPVPAGQGSESEIEKIDIVKMTLTENPYCITNSDGKVKILVKMDRGERLVRITRQ